MMEQLEFDFSLKLRLMSGMWKVGDEFPNHDFSEIKKNGVKTSGPICASNEDIRRLIEFHVDLYPLSRWCWYFYYKVDDR